MCRHLSWRLQATTRTELHGPRLYSDVAASSTAVSALAALDARGLRVLGTGADLATRRAGFVAGAASFGASADFTTAFSSLFCSRKRATRRSSFATCTSNSALFSFGA